MIKPNPTAESFEETPREPLFDIDLLSHPFFNWRWSVVDVALIFVLVYTIR